jgi:type I restriction enzyme R subunit
MTPELDHNEAKTRRKLIDKKLYAAQWEEIPTSDIEDEYVITPGRLIGGGQHSNPRKADYVLTYLCTRQFS